MKHTHSVIVIYKIDCWTNYIRCGKWGKTSRAIAIKPVCIDSTLYCQQN